MWFRLAKELGMSVRRCMEEVSSAEFAYWKAFYDLEPFGDRVADLRAGIGAATFANSQRSKDTEPFKPIDFIPWMKQPDDPDPVEPSPEVIASVVFGIDLAEIKRNGKQTVIQRPKPGRAA